MPTYVYSCRNCQLQEEIQASMKDPAPTSLRACQAGGSCNVFKIMQPVARSHGFGGDTPELVSSGKDKSASEQHVCSSNCPVHKLIHKAL